MAADFGRSGFPHGIIYQKAARTTKILPQPSQLYELFCCFHVSHCRSPLVALVQVVFEQQALTLPLFEPPAFFSLVATL